MLFSEKMTAEKLIKGGIKIKTEYLLQKEVEHVLAALTPSNRLVMRVCLHTGLRVSDVLSLKPEQIKPSVWVTESKTGKRKLIGFPEKLRADLLAITGKNWVFESRINPKKHRTRQTVWADVKRAAKAFRLPQNVGTHSARKIYAVDLLERYGSIEKVRKSLNHDRYSTTLIYAMADRLLQAKYKKRGGA